MWSDLGGTHPNRPVGLGLNDFDGVRHRHPWDCRVCACTHSSDHPGEDLVVGEGPRCIVYENNLSVGGHRGKAGEHTCGSRRSASDASLAIGIIGWHHEHDPVGGCGGNRNRMIDDAPVTEHLVLLEPAKTLTAAGPDNNRPDGPTGLAMGHGAEG